MYIIENNAGGLRSDAIEKAFSELERVVAPVIKTISKDRIVPTGEDLSNLLSFIALLDARLPATQDNLNQIIDSVFKIAMQQIVATESNFKQTISKLLDNGHEPIDTNYDEFKKM